MAKKVLIDVENLPSLVLGFLVNLRDEVEEKIDELIKEGEELAKKAKEKIQVSEEKEEKKEPSKLEKSLTEIAEKLGIATTSQLEEIEKRIDRLIGKAMRGKK
jgi:polyhydroxyalkanoate synthesis regulator phasin